MQINKYDTIKDKDGQRYRIIEVSEDLQVVKAVKINTNGDKVLKGGRPRLVKIADINGKDYIRVDLPPVKVTKQEPKPPTPEEVKKQIQEGNITDDMAMSPEEQEILKEAETLLEENKRLRQQEQDVEILREELKDKIRENIDLKKTISKMQQAHDAEVEDLNDQLMEARALGKKAGEYASALDEDSDDFEAIADLLRAAAFAARSLDNIIHSAARRTEGRI